jgi:APA family basic amino acid/polyamine antiporter
MPFFPLLPLLFIGVMSMFLIAAMIANPLDSLIGVALTLAGVPVYMALAKQSPDHDR